MSAEENQICRVDPAEHRTWESMDDLYELGIPRSMGIAYVIWVGRSLGLALEPGQGLLKGLWPA